jgi:outer membrane protein TolC
VTQAEEALRIVRERYAEGMAVMVELLGAEAARTTARAGRAAAARDAALAEAALGLATGTGPATR